MAPLWYYFLVLNVCRDVGTTYNDRRSLHKIAGRLGGAIRPSAGPRQTPGGCPGGEAPGSSKESASYST